MIGRAQRQGESTPSPIDIGGTRVRAVADPMAPTDAASAAAGGGAAGVGTAAAAGPAAGADAVTDPADPVAVAWRALGCVYDPELCIDVVTLGLVYDIYEEPPAVVVEMTLTTPGCPASETLPDMARAAIADALGGTRPVTVQVVWEPPWNPAMMDDDAAASLGVRRR